MNVKLHYASIIYVNSCLNFNSALDQKRSGTEKYLIKDYF